MVAPTPTDTICDPACGTAGFLVAAGEHLREQHPDLLDDEARREHFHERGVHGLRLRRDDAADREHEPHAPRGRGPGDRAPRRALDEAAGIRDRFSLVLANPPFTGLARLRADGEGPASGGEDAKKTELLFLRLILRILEPGGRAAVIVPDGVLFGSTKAHKAIREELVEEHQLDAVVSMPSGVFKPYAGVSTAVLVFTKTGTGGTGDVWFYEMRADGLSLDDKRQPVDANDLPDLLARWRDRENEGKRERTAQSFTVPKEEIAAEGYDLSFNRYREVEYEAVEYEPPAKILADLRALEEEIRTTSTRWRRWWHEHEF